jgi:FkbM family methyltransferase
MLARPKAAALWVLREAASLPIRVLGERQRGRALQKLTGAMVREALLPEGPLHFMTPTPLLQGRAAALLSKEPDTIAWIDSFEADDVFWDVGANVGAFSLYAARRRGVRVLAFEPAADNYTVLCRNIEINALDQLITAYCIALAGSTELGVINSRAHEMGAAMHQFGKRGEVSRYWSGAKSTNTQGMIGFTVDDFIRQFRPSFPTRLKFDVDGLEWQILQGSFHTLRDPRLQSVMAELTISDRAELDRVLGWMSDAGFDLVKCGDEQETGGVVGANHFFMRRKK